LNISTPVTTVLRVSRKPTISDFLAHLHLAALDAARHHRAPPLNRKNVFDRHQERLVQLARRLRHALVHRFHQRVNLLLPLLFAVQRAQRRQPNHRHIVARKLIALQQFAHFQLNQIEQLGIVHRIALVQRNHNVRHAHLTRQEHVLARLRHRTIRRRHHQNRAIHLRRARDHVLDVIRVPRAIHVRVVPVRRLILDVRRGNRDAARLLFRSVVDRIERPEHDLRVVLLQYLRDRRRQRRLAVVDVTNRPYVAVRLRPFKFFFAICSFPL
jgi:hypothetical protein